MSTPGSSNWRAPFTRKVSASSVLPDPGPPQTSVGRPFGSPPLVTSSRAGIPVGAFGRAGPTAVVVSAMIRGSVLCAMRTSVRKLRARILQNVPGTVIVGTTQERIRTPTSTAGFGAAAGLASVVRSASEWSTIATVTSLLSTVMLTAPCCDRRAQPDGQESLSHMKRCLRAVILIVAVGVAVSLSVAALRPLVRLRRLAKRPRLGAENGRRAQDDPGRPHGQHRSPRG